MANYNFNFNGNVNVDVQQMVVMSSEEAAAVGQNYSQQQPPPQQHVVNKTAFQQQQYVLVTSPNTVGGEPNISVNKAPSTIQMQSVQQDQPQIILNAQQLQQMIPGKSFIIRTITPSQQVAQSIGIQKMTDSQPVVSGAQVVSTLQADSQTVIQRNPLQTPPRLLQQSQVPHVKTPPTHVLPSTPSPQRPMLVNIRSGQGQLTQLQPQLIAKTPRPPLLRRQKNSSKTPPNVHLKQNEQGVMNQQTISALSAVQSVQTVQSSQTAQSTPQVSNKQSLPQALPVLSVQSMQQVQDSHQTQQGQVQQVQSIQVQSAQTTDQEPSNHQNGNVISETKVVEASCVERDSTKVASLRTVTVPSTKTQLISTRKEEPKIIVTSPQTVVPSKVGQRPNLNSPILKGVNVQYVMKQANSNQVSVVPQQNLPQVQSPQTHFRIVRLNPAQLQQLQGVMQIPQQLSGQSQPTLQFQVPHNMQMQVQPHILQLHTNTVQQSQQAQLQPDMQQPEEEAHSQQQPTQIQVQQQLVHIQSQQQPSQPPPLQQQSLPQSQQQQSLPQPQEQPSQLLSQHQPTQQLTQQQQSPLQTQQPQIQLQTQRQLHLVQQQQPQQQIVEILQPQQQQASLQSQHHHAQQSSQLPLLAQQQLVQRKSQVQPDQQIPQKVQQSVQPTNVQLKQSVQQHPPPLINQLPQAILTQTAVNGLSTGVTVPQNAVKVQPMGSRPPNPSSQTKARLPNTYSGPRQKKQEIRLVSCNAPGSQPVSLSQAHLDSIIKKFGSVKETRIVQYTEGGTTKLVLQKLPHVPQIQTLAPETLPVQEEDQITIFDGVNVEDAFPTGVPQECVVSESGELLFADNTNVKLEPIIDSSDVNSNSAIIGSSETSISGESFETISSSSLITKFMEPELKILPGKAALCGFCGYLSTIINKCQRCQRSLPDTVKLVPIPSTAQTLTATSTGTNVLVRRTVALPEKAVGKPIARPLQPLPRALHPLPNLPSVDPKRKRPTAHRRPKVKVPEEPEILTLSSDDEDKKEVKSEKKPDRESQLLANGAFSSLSLESRTEDTATMDEADSAEETRQNTAAVKAVTGGGLLEQAVEGSMSSHYILIVCRTIRIGTFRVKPSERVVISSQGFEIKLPLPGGPEVIVNVGLNYIERVLVSFCRSMPVLFFYLKKEGGVLVRQILNMRDPKPLYYFDPQSSDDAQKRITLLPEKISEDQKIALKKIFEGRIALLEIDNSVANEILVKSSPSEIKLKLNLPGNDIQTILVYPPPPARGGIPINTEDYACLGEDMFLNDVIIDFYLKYLMQSVLSDEDRERTHVFSTFFYKRLTSKPKKGRRHPVEDNPALTPAQKRHDRVKGWTKSVNLFSKDFIIIPINENSHWFLAIICYPGQDGCVRMSDNTPIDIPKPQPTTVAAAVAAAAAAATTHSKLKVKDNVMSIGSTTITPVKATPAATITLDHNGEEGSDRDEAEGDEEEMNENSEDEDSGQGSEESNGSKDPGGNEEISTTPSTTMPVANTNPVPTKKGKSFVRDGIKQPCILIFDSLVGAPRYRVAATLREYLSIEYKVKEKKDKEFSKDTIKGMLPKVPQQTNFTDCGLYLLQYAEMFFKDPIRDYHAPIKQLINWFPEEVVSRKREDIAILLKDLMREQNIDPNSINLPILTFNNHLKAQQQAEDEEALARLAAADSEADSKVNQTSQVTPMEENVSCENEVTLPHSTTEDISLKLENEDCGAINNEKISEQPSSLKQSQPLVDYPDSSNDSNSDNSLVKRTQSDTEDVIERKKMKKGD